MSADHKTTRRTAAKKVARKPALKPAKGMMGKSETVPLAIAAREALTYQIHLGNEAEGTDFREWRHAQVREITGKDGLTACAHDDFQPLMRHFQTLAGKDDKAFSAAMKEGMERRKQLAHEILRNLREHIRLADATWTDLLADFAEQGRDDKWVNKAMDRKLHIEGEGGPIREGYLVAIARQKTRRPLLSLGNDLEAGLADRCTEKQLRDLLSTLVNRINAKEGVGETGRRNRKQASPAEKRRRSPETLAPRPQEPTSGLLDGLGLHEPRD